MTIDEAIHHCEAVVIAQEDKCRHAGHDHYTKLESAGCAAEHRQLGKWLKELKRLRVIHCRGCRFNYSGMSGKEAKCIKDFENCVRMGEIGDE